MSNNGKHTFPSEGVLNSATFICRHIACIIKVAELNTPSDGNGITGINSAVF